MAIRKTAEKKEAEKKAPARRPAATTTRKRKPKVTHEHIAERAYFIALERGGDQMENWLLAERELVGA